VCSVFVFPFLQGDFLVSPVLFLQVISCFGPAIGTLSMVFNWVLLVDSKISFEPS
jgi:hypothetical protein